MNTECRTIRTIQLTIALAAVALGVAAAPPVEAAPDSVSGRAYGASVDAGGVSVGQTPLATLPAGGGMVADEAASLTVPNVLGADTLRAMTTGAVGGGAVGLATVENVNILNGLITAKLVVPISTSTGDGVTASSDSIGSALVDLVVNGVALGSGVPAPNTRIEIPGVGTLILNEQTASGDGIGTSALTVTMIHLVLKNPLTGATTGDIAVGSARSGVFTAPFVPAHVIPPEGCVFYTGGGRLDNYGGTATNHQAFATFGFNATTRNRPGGCGPHGQLQFTDHEFAWHIHGISADIDGEDVDPAFGGPCALFSGTARVRQGNTNLGEHPYSARACDNGEPGVDRDWFSIVVPGVGYDSSPTKNPRLRGGNIQRHAH